MANYRTFPYKLPSGNDITFREPFNADREHVIQFLKELGPSPDELLASHCLLSINGSPLQFPDPRQNMKNWGVKDSTAYLTLFMEMFSLSKTEVEDIKLQAKKLMGGFAAPDQNVSNAYATPPAQPTSLMPPAQAYTASAPMASSTPAAAFSPASTAPTQPGAISVGFEDGSALTIDPSVLDMLEQDLPNQI